MTKKIVTGFVIFLMTAACNKLNNSTSVGNVIHSLKTDSSQTLADGTGLVHVSVILDSLATSDRSGVLFRLNTGNFAGTAAANAADTTEVVQAQFVGNSLVASAVVQVPQTPGWLIISAQPNVTQMMNNNNYILKDSVRLLPSVPDSVYLTASSAGIASNYGSQVTLTGVLFNSLRGKVSLGYSVAFGDSLQGPVYAGGYWVSMVDTSNATSQVSGIYSIGPGSVGTPITITCTVLDSTGKKTSVSGSTLIYINK